MKTGTLLFPDNAMLADFLVCNAVRGMAVNSKEHSVTGNLPAVLIADACKSYGACFKLDIRLL
jgi:hypothetical protein